MGKMVLGVILHHISGSPQLICEAVTVERVGVVRSMGDCIVCFLRLGRDLGYKLSYFNLVFESNPESYRLWDGLLSLSHSLSPYLCLCLCLCLSVSLSLSRRVFSVHEDLTHKNLI
jgi:hypothetical protein